MLLTAIASNSASIDCLKSELRVDGVLGAWLEDAHLGSGIQEGPRLGNIVPYPRSDVNLVVEGGSKNFM